MDKSSLHDLATRLLVTPQRAAGHHVDPAAIISDKWRVSLTKFAGVEGFSSLLRRALSMARADMPFLHDVKVGVDGRLEGFELMDASVRSEAAVTITAHLLELLVSFIGETLTLRLARDVWPDALLDTDDLSIENNS